SRTRRRCTTTVAAATPEKKPARVPPNMSSRTTWRRVTPDANVDPTYASGAEAKLTRAPPPAHRAIEVATPPGPDRARAATGTSRWAVTTAAATARTGAPAPARDRRRTEKGWRRSIHRVATAACWTATAHARARTGELPPGGSGAGSVGALIGP